MLRDDSPLKELPTNIDRKQMLFLDGVRHCADTCDLAYGQLAEQLTTIARSKGRVDPRLVTSVFMHAWAVVDNMHRLSGLLEFMPGYEFIPDPGKQTFKVAVEKIIAIRNVADHVGMKMSQVVANGAPTLGSLKWVTASDQEKSLGTSCTLIPGTVADGFKATFDSKAPRTEVGQTDHICLTAGKFTASLTDAMGAVYQTVKSIEAALDAALKDSKAAPPWGENTVVRAYMNVDGTGAQTTIHGLRAAAFGAKPPPVAS